MALRVAIALEGDKKFRAVVRSIALPRAKGVHERSLRKNAKAVRMRSRGGYLSGQALRRRTGRLWRSMDVDLRDLPRSITIGTAHPGAGVLHFGWPSRRQRARPFLFPAVIDERPRFPEVWVREYEKHIAAQGAV